MRSDPAPKADFDFAKELADQLAGILKPLPRSFYESSTVDAANKLLGHWLVRRTPQGWAGGMIVETEAYLRDDPACHAFGGETKRNRSMFGPPGRAYVYRIYGMHHCVNAVCGPVGRGEAVLIRALELCIGIDLMRAGRGGRDRDLTNGPGRLCAALRIDAACDAMDLCDASSPLVVLENPLWEECRRALGPVQTTPRIGITKAADQLLRFFLEGSCFVSRKNPRPR